MSLTISKFLYYLFFCSGAVLAQKCYLPNGVETNIAHGVSNAYQTCNQTRPGGQHSMCCRLGDGTNKCLDSGLCVDNGKQEIWRESCTDPTWQDPGCLKLFIEGTDSYNGAFDSNDVMLRSCEDGSFCNGPMNISCCQQRRGFHLRDGVVSPTSSGASSNPTTIAVATPTTSVLTTSSSHAPPMSSTSTPPNASATNSISTGAIVGITAAGAVVGALFAAAIFLLLRRRKSAVSAETSACTEVEFGDSKNFSSGQTTRTPSIQSHEMPVRKSRQPELPTPNLVHEMEPGRPEPVEMYTH